MIYRVTFGYEGKGVGWAETHAMLSALNNPKELLPTLVDIAAKRVMMLGREFAIIAIRVSRYATDAGVRARGAKIHKQTFRIKPVNTSTDAEPSNVALLVRGSAEPSILNPLFDANQNTCFLGAPLDKCVNAAGEVDEAMGGLGGAFGAWRSAMLGTTMGWLANQTILDIDLVSIAQNLNGTVTLTTDGVVTPSLVVGQIYKARCRAINGGRSPLNIELKVRVLTATTLQTRRIIGIPTAQTNGSIRIYKQIQPFVDYGDLELSDRVGKHKRGRPFGSQPGRDRARILG